MYSLLAAGLLMEYRSSGVVNFAHGALAMFTAYVYVELRATGRLQLPVIGLPDRVTISRSGMDALPATMITLLYASALGVCVYALVFRPLRTATPLTKVVASLGLMVILQSLAVLKFGTSARTVSSSMPRGSIHMAGSSVPLDRFYLAGVAAVVALALAVTFRHTSFGRVTRAVAEDERAAAYLGYSADRVACINWVVATMLAALAGMLIAPITSLNPASYTLFIIPALGAALLARFSSFTVALVAGFGIGMAQSAIGRLQTELEWLPRQGLQSALPLVAIIVAMVVFGRALPTRGAIAEEQLPLSRPASRLWTKAALGLVVGSVAMFVLDSPYRVALIGSLLFAFLCLSVVVVTGYVGQLSLGQVAFAGVGGFTASKLGTELGLDFPWTLLAAAAVAALAGALVGAPALRVRGVQLAIVTLSAGLALDELVFRHTSVSGAGGSPVPELNLFGLDLDIRGASIDAYPRAAFGIAVLVLLTAGACAVAHLRRMPLGKRMLAVRSDEQAAAASGINVARTKLTAFVFSAAIAGAAGALIGYQQHVLSAEPFGVFVSLQVLAFAYIGGVARVAGAIFAGLVLAPNGLAVHAWDSWFGIARWEQLIGGFFLIVTAILHREGATPHLEAGLRSLAARLPHRRKRSDVTPAAPPASDLTPRAAPDSGAPVLEVRDLTVRYGGVTAVQDVSLSVNSSEIVGLIGPNGAGKTTLIDAVSGFVKPAAGTVLLDGLPLDGLSVHERARRGLARTFQGSQLFDDLTVRENLEVQASDKRDCDAALELMQVDDRAMEMPGQLPFGQRRLAGVARALVTRPRIILLDEPAAGLDSHESEKLGARLRTLRDRGFALLLVDHDMNLVLDVCDRVLVLDQGGEIFKGLPKNVRLDQAVVSAYLGVTGRSAVPPDRDAEVVVGR